MNAELINHAPIFIMTNRNSNRRRALECALLALALFALVGGIGLFIHMSVLWFALTVAGAAFNSAQACAAIVAMTSNFFLNNLFT